MVNGYMQRALELAEKAVGGVSPNPAVGAVVVKGGDIVGTGYTQPPGGPHAEVVALAQAGDAARGAALYVTLEPCCHHGRTPPCTKAIIEAGITEVHIALEDPDPNVNGAGRKQMESAGIRIYLGESAPQAKLINEAYIKHRRTGRPFVIAKFAASLDGRIAAAGGDSRWISGPQTLAWGHEMRTRIDAIAVGVETVLVDNPLLTARPQARLAPARQPLRIVLDSRGRTPTSAHVLTGSAPTLIATTSRSDARWRNDIIAQGAEVIVLPEESNGRVNLEALLEELGRRDVLSLLIEGGGVLLGSFFDQRIVDKVAAVIAPLIIGASAASAPVAGIGAQRMADATHLAQTDVTRLGDDLLVTGYPIYPQENPVKGGVPERADAARQNQAF